jgi:hypothetical protein
VIFQCEQNNVEIQFPEYDRIMVLFIESSEFVHNVKVAVMGKKPDVFRML